MTVPYIFRQGCVRAGFALTLIFVFRVISDAAGGWLSGALMSLPGSEQYAGLISICVQCVVILILYGGCMLTTAWALDFRKSRLKGMYRKPERLGKAVSWVVPCYGAAQLVNIIVTAIALITAGDTAGAENLEYQPIIGGDAVSAAELVFLAFQNVVIAPVLEELWFRGIIQTSLDECGHGFAILVSAFAFGLAHGNFQQFCYATVIGIFFGYVRYASGSLIPGTIMHFIINSLATVLIIIVTNPEFVPAITKYRLGEELSAGENACVAVFAVYMIIMIILIIVGVCAAIGKFRRRRLYLPANNFPALSKGRKLSALFATPDFLLGLVLCLAYMFGLWTWLLSAAGAV